MATGTVKFSLRTKASASSPLTMGGPDVFGHISAVGFGASLTDGQKVSCDMAKTGILGDGKSKAENVRDL